MATAPTLIGQYKLWLSAYTISLEQGAFLWDTRLGLDEMREDPRFLDRGTRGSEPLLRMLEPDEQSARTRHSIDDTSPQLVYSGNWTDWRPANDDPDIGRYFRGTFHSTSNEGAYVSYTFNGTAAWVFGSFWLNHGAFSASVDGGNEVDVQGYTPNREFDQVLFKAGDLADGTHEIRMFNRPSRTTIFETNLTKLNGDSHLWFDLDYIVVQVPISEGNNVTTRVIDDTDATITYSPEWRQRLESQDGYYNVSAHDTNIPGAGFAVPFKGTSIQLFGMIGPDVGNYSISIDGQTYPSELNGTWYERRTNSPLFFISGLPDGPHVFNLVNLGRGVERSTFEFDYAVVNTTTPTRAANVTAPDGGVDNPSAVSTLPPPTGTGTGSGSGDGTTVSGTGASGQHSGGASTGAIIGGVVGGLGAVALLALLLLCLRKRRIQRAEHDSSASQGNSDYFEKTPVSSRFVLPLSPLLKSRGRGSNGNPVPYQGGHAPRGISSAHADDARRHARGGSSSYRHPGAETGSAMNRAALGTSINTMTSHSGSQANSNSHSMMKRGFDPTSDVSSTTWEGSPGPASPASPANPDGEVYASPSMHLLHQHPGGYSPGPGHRHDRENGHVPWQHVPLSALPHGQGHHWLSPNSPLSPVQYSAGYPHLGTPISTSSPPVHPGHFHSHGHLARTPSNPSGAKGYPSSPTTELLYSRGDNPVHDDGDGVSDVDGDVDGGELHPHDSCSNVGGPTYTHTYTEYETAPSRPTSPQAQASLRGDAGAAVLSSRATSRGEPRGQEPPGYVESVDSGMSGHVQAARSGKR